MNGDVIKSYLVSLGFSVNESEFQKMNSSLQNASRSVQQYTSQISKHFIQASTEIVTSLAAVTTATAAMVDKVVQADIKYQNMALTMHMTVEATRQMDMALKAMGTTIEGVAWNPEQRQQYFSLLAQQRQMSVGAGGEAAFKDARNVRFEFVRMKLEAQYSLMWISYMLIEKLGGPLGSVKDKLKSFNDYVSIHMPQIADKIANWIIMTVNLFKTVIHYAETTILTLERLWNSLTKGQKEATVLGGIITAFFAVGPLGKARIIISSLLLLLDDLYAYMDGRKSSARLSPMWDDLNKKSGQFREIINQAKDLFIDLVVVAKEFIKSLISSGALTEVLKMFLDISKAVISVSKGLWEVIGLVNRLFGIRSHGFVDTITEAVREFAFLGRSVAAIFDMIGLAAQGKFSAVVNRGREFMSDYRQHVESVKRFDRGDTASIGGGGSYGSSRSWGGGSGVSSRGGVGGGIDEWIAEASRTYGISENVIRGVIQQESGFNPNATSSVGAIGYMQLMPETASGLGVNPYDPQENIMGGTKYLSQQLQTFGGDLPKALAAYNAGPGAVQKYGGIPPYAETQNYVSSIMNNISGGGGGFSGLSMGAQNFQSMTNGAYQSNGGGGYASHTSIGDVNVNITQPNATQDQIYTHTLSAIQDAIKKQNARNIYEFQGVNG